jgi:hypothetical protein
VAGGERGIDDAAAEELRAAQNEQLHAA